MRHHNFECLQLYCTVESGVRAPSPVIQDKHMWGDLHARKETAQDRGLHVVRLEQEVAEICNFWTRLINLKNQRRNSGHTRSIFGIAHISATQIRTRPINFRTASPEFDWGCLFLLRLFPACPKIDWRSSEISAHGFHKVE